MSVRIVFGACGGGGVVVAAAAARVKSYINAEAYHLVLNKQIDEFICILGITVFRMNFLIIFPVVNFSINIYTRINVKNRKVSGA